MLSDYKQYEVGVGDDGQEWDNPIWKPRNDSWDKGIGYHPDACKALNVTGTVTGWISHIGIPATVKCLFDDSQFNAISANNGELRRFVYKYQHPENFNAVKKYCGAMVTVNGKQVPRYLTATDTFCKSIIVDADYAEFVDEICNANPTAEYCACYNRSNDPAFVADGNLVPYEDAVCWYKPCVFNTGFKDPRLTSTCETNICPRVRATSGVSICE